VIPFLNAFVSPLPVSASAREFVAAARGDARKSAPLLEMLGSYGVTSAADAIAIVREWLARAERIVVLTGAGISTDSGIPDFRGPQGLWTRNPAAEKMATLQHYMGDGEVRKRAWRSRLETFETERQPNAGHRALADLERTGRLVLLITQNVDGLHQRAGSTQERIVEIHGTVREVVCMACGERAPMERALARVRAGEEDPPCRSCGGILKSATISFGQGLVADDLERAQEAAAACDLLLAVGTTLAVFPVAGVVPIAKAAGARIVIVNAEPTEMDALADAVLRGSISEILPALVAPR
jgi:NAD-dependent deacetylase